jgi:AraC family transcriptional regulator
MSLVERLLARWLVHDIEGIEPRIVTLEAPIQVVGLTMATDLARARRDVARMGRNYLAIQQRFEIPDRKVPWGVVAIRKDLDRAAGSFTYMVGDVVTSLERVPEGLVGFEIPAATYAVFPVRSRNRLGWGLAVNRAKKYAYESWLPRSPYRPGGAVDDFEYHDERCVRKPNLEIDLYVAVTKW